MKYSDGQVRNTNRLTVLYQVKLIAGQTWSFGSGDLEALYSKLAQDMAARVLG